jgi:hypothetical protein
MICPGGPCGQLAYLELRGDLLVQAAGDDESHDLPFVLGQCVEARRARQSTSSTSTSGARRCFRYAAITHVAESS